MFALGIGNQIVMEELIGIASDPFIDDDGNNVTFVFMATDFNALLSIRNQLRDAACDVTAGTQRQSADGAITNLCVCWNLVQCTCS